MAKPASDPKVEDVLSSVRRLVSGEMPKNERPEPPEAPGALVLTNAQRIESPAPDKAPDPKPEPVKTRSLEERISELEVAVNDTTDAEEFEPDGSEDQSLHRPDRIVYTRPALDAEGNARPTSQRLSQIALLDTEPTEGEATGDESAPNNGQFRHDKADPTETPAEAEITSKPEAASEAASEAPMAVDVPQPKRSAEIRAFSSPDDEIARIEARLNGSPDAEAPKNAAPAPITLETPEQADDTPEDVATDDVDNITLDASDDDWSETEPSSDIETPANNSPLELGTPVALPDAEIDAAEDDIDDFEEALSEAVASSIEESTPPAEPTAEASADPEAASDDNLLAGGLAQAATGAVLSEMMTEETLQPLVAKLIREELQGELGERITRNVRKLVRREILRAMTTREIE